MRMFIPKPEPGLLLVTLLIIFAVPNFIQAGNYTVDHYEFGKIVINGQTYENDIVIMPDGSVQPGPEDMHYIQLDEIEDILNTPGLKTLVVGTGAEGNGMLTRKLLKAIKTKGITIEMMLTEDAMKMLNESPKDGLVAMLHLNC